MMEMIRRPSYVHVAVRSYAVLHPILIRKVSMEGPPMGRKASVLGLLLFMLLLSGQVLADKRSGKHTHDEKAPQGQTMGGHTHKHDAWEPPPLEYAGARSTRWDDPAAAARGEPLFQTYCLVCHGTDGRGTGPAAIGLPHAPADLTNHFHRAPGDGDAYLFWRVSEGGEVEPFRSMQSTMPAFKTVLSEDQRWDVLAYVHAKFHGGFLPKSVTGEGTVIAVVPASEELVVKHGDIKGFMGPMTMGYKVSPPSLLKRLKAGDPVRFTIDTEQKAIVTIEKLRK
jgi:mono/diheme cytochrome c family protein